MTTSRDPPSSSVVSCILTFWVTTPYPKQILHKKSGRRDDYWYCTADWPSTYKNLCYVGSLSVSKSLSREREREKEKTTWHVCQCGVLCKSFLTVWSTIFSWATFGACGTGWLEMVKAFFALLIGTESWYCDLITYCKRNLDWHGCRLDDLVTLVLSWCFQNRIVSWKTRKISTSTISHFCGCVPDLVMPCKSFADPRWETWLYLL